MKEIFALAKKDLCLLLRDKAGFIFAFIFPLVYAVFFGMVFSNMGAKTTSKMEIAVVDEDATEESQAFVRSLQSSAEIKVTPATMEEAINSVRRGQRVAYLILPSGFGAQREGLIWGDPPTITVGTDPSRQAESAMLHGLLIKCMFENIQSTFEDQRLLASRLDVWIANVRAADHLDPAWRGTVELALTLLRKLAPNSEPSATAKAELAPTLSPVPVSAGRWQPIIVNNQNVARHGRPTITSYAWTFPQGIIWGVMGCSAAFGISLVIERNGGTLVRLRMAPMKRWRIVAGKAFACFVTTLGMMVALLLLAAFAFDVRPNSLWLLAAATIATDFAFVGIMMLLATMGKTEQSAGGIGWSVLLVMAMIGGGMVPSIFMPSWMQTVSHFSPVKWGINVLEGALWRGFSPSEMAIPCAILTAIGLACFALGVRVFRWTE